VTDFKRVAAVGDVPVGGLLEVRIDGKPVVLANLEGEILAVGGRCTHSPVLLEAGELYDETLECPMHGGAFNIRTGEAVAWPCFDPIPTYPVQIDGDDILVGWPTPGIAPLNHSLWDSSVD
jgi:3-phenylpropionate/trans-cinnamate dioxygenase ferredoxin component